MKYDLAGKVVVVIGGAGLLGRTFVESIIQSNGLGIIADIDEKSGRKILDAMREKYGNDKAEFVKIDITSASSLRHAIRSLEKKYGKIDALVNSAYPRNKNFGKRFEDVAYPDFCENINLHLGGYFLSCQQFADFFKRQGYGNIVNIASIYGVIPPRFEIYKGTKMVNTIEYAAIKSAIIHMTKYMAKYFKDFCIRVNAISPGGILDNQPKPFLRKYRAYCLTKGMLMPQDVSHVLLFLLSDASKYISGQNIVIDDGFSL